MGGIILDQPLPFRGTEQIDPFLLVHHWSDTIQKGKKQLESGVGPHPHRGFSPVTFIFKGGIFHQDSQNHRRLVEAGGTQWMNSGSGVVHSERPSKKLVEQGGEFEIIQFWINTPAAHKMDEYSYQPLDAKDTPIVLSADKKVKISVVAGEFNGIKGKISTFTDVLILRLELDADGQTEINIPEDYNAFLYQLDGSLLINDQQNTKAKDLTWFNNDEKKIKLKATADTRAILLTGKPIREPMVSYGPFVMNTEQEIRQTMTDYQNGQLGTLHEVEES